MEQRPQPRVQEDRTETVAGEGQAPPAIFVQEGEEVKEAFTVELGEEHGGRTWGGNRPTLSVSDAQEVRLVRVFHFPVVA